MNLLERVLVRIAAASPERLDQCPDTERTKYVRLGLFVGLSTLSATAAGTFAGLRIFPSQPLPASVVGAGYGLFVYGLDSYLVTTIRSESRWQTAVQAGSRLILAAVVGTVIAVPLEIMIVRDRLARIREEQQQKEMAADQKFYERQTGLTSAEESLKITRTDRTTHLKQLGEDPSGAQFQGLVGRAAACQSTLARAREDFAQKEPPLTSRIRALDLSIADAEAAAQDARSSAAKQQRLERADLQDRRRNLKREVDQLQSRCQEYDDVVAEARLDYQQRVQGELDAIDRHIVTLESQEQKATGQLNSQMARSSATAAQAYGPNLLAEFDALGILKATNPNAWWFAVGLWVLLVTIDSAPVVAKLAAGHGPYDELVAAEEARVTASARANRKFYEDGASLHMAAAIEANFHRQRAIDDLEATSRALLSALEATHAHASEFEVLLRKAVATAVRNDPDADLAVMEGLIRELRARVSAAQRVAFDRFEKAIRDCV